MASIKMSSTRNVVASIKYVLNDKSKDGIHERVASVNAHNMTIFNAHNEAMQTLKRYNKTNNIHANIVIQSFSDKELNPKNLEDIEKANKIGTELAKKLWGENRQLLIVTHTDNAKVHNHLIGVSPDLTTGKSIRGNAKNRKHVISLSDDIIKKHDVLNINAIMQREYVNRISIGEIKRKKQGLYVWKDDLKQRIEDCINNQKITDISLFVEEMKNKYKVDVRLNGKGNISYAFIDNDNKNRIIRASRLGNVYGRKGIDYGITDNKYKQRQQQRKIAEIDRRTREIDRRARERNTSSTSRVRTIETTRENYKTL